MARDNTERIPFLHYGIFKRSPIRTDKNYGLKTLYEPTNAVVDIVFIHGLTGDRDRTWAAGKGVKPWPETLLPPKIPEARILSFGYDAAVVGWRSRISTNRLGDHAKNLLSALAAKRVGNDGGDGRPIIFVAHSLGGLICQDALISSKASAESHLRAIFNCTHGILFLGTPHSGTSLANIAERFSQLLSPTGWTNHRIVEVLRKDSEVLSRMQNDFHSLLRCAEDTNQQKIKITCFYEELPVPGIGQIVPKHSAIIPGYTAIGIHSDHREIARFRTEEDSGFISILAELQRWICEIDCSFKVKSRESTMVLGNGEDTSKQIHGSINIWGNVTKSPISSTQIIHGNLIFT